MLFLTGRTTDGRQTDRYRQSTHNLVLKAGAQRVSWADIRRPEINYKPTDSVIYIHKTTVPQLDEQLHIEQPEGHSVERITSDKVVPTARGE